MLAAPQNSDKKSYNCFLCQHMKYFWWTLFQSRNRWRVKIFFFWKAWISFLFVAGLFCSWVCICLDKVVASCTARTSVLFLVVLPSSLSLIAIILLLISSAEECFARTTLKQFNVHFCYLHGHYLHHLFSAKKWRGRKNKESVGKLKKVTILNVYVTPN